MFQPNHLHLLVKGHLKSSPREEEDLNIWLRSLVEKVRMVVLSGPTSIYVEEPGNEGLTGTVTLATSHAAIHIWDRIEPPFFQFDLYSCSDFSAEEVIEHLNEFELISYEYMFIDRNNEMKILQHYKS